MSHDGRSFQKPRPFTYQRTENVVIGRPTYRIADAAGNRVATTWSRRKAKLIVAALNAHAGKEQGQ